MKKLLKFIEVTVLLCVILLIVLFVINNGSSNNRLRIGGFVRFSPSAFGCDSREQLNAAEFHLQNSQKDQFDAMFPSHRCVVLNAGAFFKVARIDSGAIEVTPQDVSGNSRIWVSRASISEVTQRQ